MLYKWVVTHTIPTSLCWTFDDVHHITLETLWELLISQKDGHNIDRLGQCKCVSIVTIFIYI